MKELRNKICILLIILLSTFLVTILCIFNISIYNKEYRDLEDKIKVFATINDKVKDKNNFNPFIIENEVYEVIFNDNKQVEKIISYSVNGLSNKEILDLVYNNYNKINKKQSLYTSDYILRYNQKGNLILINNHNIKNYLLNELIKTLITFTILEIIIVLGSIKITKWLVKPVDEMFNKQKQFIYDASHELKTPIAIISASAETLENNPKEKKWLTTIKEENERMGKLVTNLLDLSKSENILEKEKYEIVNLSKIIKNKALSFESLTFEKRIELDTNIEKDIMFNCNSDRIKELLSILMDNAIKHSIENTKMEVSLKKEKKNIILRVSNHGEEIPVSERDKIFERFYRVDKSRNRNEFRYGLGLSIAKNIVINHKGIIKVDCKDGLTTFTVIFKEN